MAYNPAGLVSHGFPFGIFTFTYALSGVAATDEAVAAAAGKAVSLDTTAPNTVKLAADGDAIFGRVYVAENRAVLGIRTASVARKFKEKLPAAPGHGITVGQRIVGAGGGLVKLATANAGAGVPSDPIVIETGTDYVVAEYL
jgi:hypothetical protein